MKDHSFTLLFTPLLALTALVPNVTTATLRTVANTNSTGGGSLRQVLSEAAAGDTINFATIVTGTIKFTNGPVTLNQNLVILGPGASTLAISGFNSNIFNVSAGTVLIADLTLRDGGAVTGGGIRLTGGALSISNCIVSDNFAPPGQGGTGGGVSATGGTLAVINSTFTRNKANLGGGIYNNGAQVALSNSTFAANEATIAGGSGAAIYNYSNSSLTVLSCTIASNLVTSGTGFGGGIRNLGTAQLRNSIVAGNSASTGPDLEGAFISDGYNLLGSGTGATGLTNGVNHDLVGANALLGALQDNGGPTPTMALQPGSAAIDQGSSTGLTTEQRARPRTFDHLMIPNAPGGDGTDMGAFEMTIVVVNTNDSGPGSLRQAIQENAEFGNYTITFSNGVAGVITLASALNIAANLTLIGPGANVLTVSGNNVDRVFAISLGAVSISGLTIANGSGGNGAGIFSSAAFSLLTIQSCVFSNNNTTASGGALYCANPGAILNSTFQNNRASGGGGGGGVGGAIYAYTGLGITNCTFIGNIATNTVFGTGRGGAITDFSGATYLHACTIVSNAAAMSGGGVAGLSTVFVRNNIIARNTAATDPDTYGNFFSHGYNLIGNSGTTTGWSAGNGDQVGSGDFPINPLLGPLQANGGPTPTLAPLAGSPVIDKGKTGPGISDQRGRARPFDYATIANATGGDGSDIGAVEISPDSPQLNIQLAGSNVVLSWSTNAADFRLQSVTNFPGLNQWTGVGGTPTILGTQYLLTNSPPPGIQFYRLIFP